MERFSSRSNEPLGVWRGYPIYLTTILSGLFIAGLVLSTLLGALRTPAVYLLIFKMPLEPSLSLWRLVTYVFIGRLSFFTPFGILLFYWWSVGIETHLGRWVLAKLLTLLVLVSPAVCAVWWWGFGTPTLSAGNYAFTCGLLVAFATLYPQTEAWGWIPFKWIAFASIACGSLMLFGDRDWFSLSELWATCAAGFAFVRISKSIDEEDYFPPLARLKNFFRRKPKFRVVPSPAMRGRVTEESATQRDMDALLDKIAKSGMASLTAKERARLEAGRAELLKKDRR